MKVKERGTCESEGLTRKARRLVQGRGWSNGHDELG